MRSRVLIVGLALVVLVLGRLCYWVEPFGVSVDEMNYLSFAKILNDGGLSYVDAVDRKPPLLYWIFQAHGAIFGDWNLTALHINFIILTLLLGFILVLITKNWMSLLVYALFSSIFPREVVSANAEYLMLFLCAGAGWIWLRSRGDNFWPSLANVFLIGVIIGLASAVKQYAVLIYSGFFLAGLLFDLKTSNFRIVFWLKQGFGFLAGFVLVWVLIGLYFWTNGAFDEFLFYCWLNGFQYIGQDAKNLNQGEGALLAWAGILLLWAPLWWMIFRSFREERTGEDDKTFLLLACGGLGALATIFISGRYYTHYFVPAIWFLSGLASYGFLNLSKPMKRFFWMASVILFASFGILNLERDRLMGAQKFSFNRGRQKQLLEVAHYIRTNSKSTDRILVWGMASHLYVMSRRAPASRYFFSDFVSGRLPGFKSTVSIPIPGAMDNYLMDLKANHPRYFIDTSPARLNDYAAFSLSRFENLESFIRDKYNLVNQIEGFDIYEIKP